MKKVLLPRGLVSNGSSVFVSFLLTYETEFVLFLAVLKEEPFCCQGRQTGLKASLA